MMGRAFRQPPRAGRLRREEQTHESDRDPLPLDRWSRFGRSSRREWGREIDCHVSIGVDHAGAKPDRGPMPLPDGTDAHYEPQAACCDAGLIWMFDHTRVTERSALQRVLAGECGTDQQMPGFRQHRPGV